MLNFDADLNVTCEQGFSLDFHTSTILKSSSVKQSNDFFITIFTNSSDIYVSVLIFIAENQEYLFYKVTDNCIVEELDTDPLYPL